MPRDKILHLIRKAMWVLGFDAAADNFLERAECYPDTVLNEKRLFWAEAVQHRIIKTR